MRKILTLALLAVPAIPAAASAQALLDDFTMDPYGGFEASVTVPAWPNVNIFVNGMIRKTALRGDWYDPATVGAPDTNDSDYGDIFKVGRGFQAELGALAKYREDWRIGLYVAGGWDHFEGDSVTYTTGGGFDVDELNTYSGYLGFRADWIFAHWFYLSTHAAGGFVRYNDVDAKAGGVTFELFDSTTQPAAEVGLRFGFGPPYFQVEGGLAYRYQMGPNRGDDVTPDVQPDAIRALVFEVGGGFKF